MFLHHNDVLTSKKTHLWASTACYGDSFTSLNVDDVRTSQGTHPWASTTCYGDSFNFLYVVDVRTSQEACASTVYLIMTETRSIFKQHTGDIVITK
jgi:hypothetical protein